MSFLFGRRKTPQEQITECRRTINRSIRSLEREQTKLEAERKKLTVNIKKAASQGSMKQVTIALGRMNRSMKLPELQKIMGEFEKQFEMMNMKEEMISDTMDDVLGEDDDVEESDALVNKVLEELGIELNMQLSGLPSTGGTIGSQVNANTGRQAVPSGGIPGTGPTDPSTSADNPVDENDLEARLARLKKG